MREPVEDVARRFGRHRCRRLPVIDGYGWLLGVLAPADLVPYAGRLVEGLLREMAAAGRPGSCVSAAQQEKPL